MHILILKDREINDNHLGYVEEEVARLYKDKADVELTFVHQDFDFSDYPIEIYYSDNLGMDRTWLRKQCERVYTDYGTTVDQVVFMCHRDNWRLDGIWGWNISKQYSGYGVQQVRFDDRNLANTVGTLYHELMHDHDSFIYTYTGKTIEIYVQVDDWDDDVVHGGRAYGGHPVWDYIRHKENQEALKAIAHLLREAIEKRNEYSRTVQKRTILALALRARVLLRKLIAEQRGDIPILVDNRCNHA